MLVGVDELALLLGESKWKASPPAPAQREKKIKRWSGGSFQAEEGGEERVWEVCKWPGRSYLQCLGPLGLPVGMLALVMALDVLSCNVTAAGLLRPSTCTRLQLPSPCRPLLLPSPLRPLGTRARAYPRGDYMSLGSDFGLAGLPLQAEFRGPPNRAFRDGRPRKVVFVCSGRRPDYIGTKPGWSTIREDWFLNGW